jgi:hypothetical protein
MESTKDRSTLNWTTDDRAGRTTRQRGVTLMALFLAVGLISVSAFAQQISGTMQVNKAQLPRGAVFLNDSAGGHWWVGDQAQGVCKVTPAGGATQPPFILTSCTAVAKSAGQLIVGNPSAALVASQHFAAGTQFLYAPDYSTTSTVVVRFVFNPAGGGSLGANTVIKVPNVTSVGGGAGGGRSVAAAVLPHNGLAANGGTSDLYVGYLKSGDIIRVDGIDNVAMNNTTPTTVRVGSTTDGRGVNSLLAFGNDLYVGEIGGAGISVINDPGGITRTACSALSVCTGISLGSIPSALPGGMATDWVPGTTTVGKFIYVGDAQRVVQNSIQKYDPATGISLLYSLNINPGYTAPDGNNIQTNWTTYTGPSAVGYNTANGDLFVGDDPQLLAAAPALQQGHFWRVIRGARIPAVTSIAPATGSTTGGTRVTVTGSNLATFNAVTGAVTTLPIISFGANAGTAVACTNAAAPPANPAPGTCSVTAPASVTAGVVDVTVTISGQTSAIVAGDKFTYTPPVQGVTTITSIAPTSGATTGGTTVTITGKNLATYSAAGVPTLIATISFGANPATSVICQPTAAPVVLPVSSVCTAVSPAGAAGIVDVQANLNGRISALSAADKFTYVTPTASLYAWGLMAPKGGATFIPGALGGHFWSSDEAEGLCRQDLNSSAGSFTIAGNTLHAANYSNCASDIIGGAGQVAYDPAAIAGTTLHYLYIGDNQIFGTLIWRLTFDSSTETLVKDPATGDLATSMIPLTSNRVLRPNGIALGPDGSLYVSSLTNSTIQKITGPSGDPRLQTLIDVAVTGDGRGANGSCGFIGNLLYISGNRATQFFDITQCPLAGGGVCGMASVPAAAGVFIAGTATDPGHKFVYLSNSAGGSPASIERYDARNDAYVAFAPGTYAPDAFGIITCTLCTTGPIASDYVGKGGLLPPPNSPNGVVTTGLTATRPWDQSNHPTAGILPGSFVPATFAFAFGIETDAAGNLVITEDPSAGARAGRGTMWFVPFVP